MQSSWLHRFAVLLAVCTLFLVVAGASVTSNQAGLSVPDWPLSYGKVMPEMTGGVLYEHGHRMIASTVGLLTVILAIWLVRADDRRWMKILGLAAVCAVILQGVLGGLTVLYMLPKPVSISHACIAQLFFSLTAAVAIFTSRSWKRGPNPVFDSGSPSLRTLSFLTPAAVLVQIAMGAGYRHRALSETPHIMGAIIVTILILFTAVVVLAQHGSHAALRGCANVLLVVTGLQVVLGLGAYWARIESISSGVISTSTIVLTILHVATGALTLAASVALAVQVARNVRPKLAVEAGGFSAVAR